MGHMKTSAALLLFFLAAYTTAKEEFDEIEIDESEIVVDFDDREYCVCCPPKEGEKWDDDRRKLCLPPAEDELLIEMNCQEEEELGTCIERLESGKEADPEVISELKEIVIRQSEPMNDFGVNGLSVMTALTASA